MESEFVIEKMKQRDIFSLEIKHPGDVQHRPKWNEDTRFCADQRGA